MKLLGVSGTMAFLAGCADEGDGDGAEDGEDETEDGEDETEDGEDGEDGEDENGDGADAEEWEGLDEIELIADSNTEWTGVSPDVIDGEENPTLLLTQGESYDITWENGNGVGHNIAIVNEDDDVVDDYSTEIMDEEGETQTLTIDEVTEEMFEYICEPHSGQMRGSIELMEGDGEADGADNETEDDADNETDDDADNETDDGDDNETED